jgi:hypothetical protein
MRQIHYSILRAQNSSTLRTPTKTSVQNAYLKNVKEKQYALNDAAVSKNILNTF